MVWKKDKQKKILSLKEQLYIKTLLENSSAAGFRVWSKEIIPTFHPRFDKTVAVLSICVSAPP